MGEFIIVYTSVQITGLLPRDTDFSFVMGDKNHSNDKKIIAKCVIGKNYSNDKIIARYVIDKNHSNDKMIAKCIIGKNHVNGKEHCQMCYWEKSF